MTGWVTDSFFALVLLNTPTGVPQLLRCVALTFLGGKEGSVGSYQGREREPYDWEVIFREPIDAACPLMSTREVSFP